ncbi:MAG: hypothetical protein MR842_04865 [Clostridiales bacterium]|nr:hypothetical protein [Clostridiales bacterium]MDO4349522.1 hypothetical protein [Eubacteriales bacterium]MDY4007783.1 hypothetical protein [Candidatus Limiplasma sp.]
MQQNAGKQSPFVFYLRVLLYMFVALLIRLVAFAPLACLFAFPTGSPFRWLALACPLLVIFVILPLRYSFAEALVQRQKECCFSLDMALNVHNYGEKLTESLMHAAHVLKWGLPLAALLGYGYYWYKDVDALTLLKTVTAIGKGWMNAWCAAGNFFFGLFGSANRLVVPANTLMEGVYVVLAVVGLGVLVWLYGAVRNSSTRYVWVLATRNERPPRTELRRRMRGRRFAQLGVALVNLVLWIPFLAVCAHVLKGLVSDVAGQMMTAIAQQSLPAFHLSSAALPLLAAFVLLYMPLLPIRRMLTAAFATRERRSSAPYDQALPQQPEGGEPAAVCNADSEADAAQRPPYAIGQ